MRPGQIADVNQTVDAVFDPNKNAEIGDVANLSANHCTHRVFLLQQAPWVWLDLLHAQGNALALLVDVQNDGADVVANVHNLGWVLHPLGPHFGNVNQAFDARGQFDECPVVRQGHHLPETRAPTGKSASTVNHGSSWICLRPKDTFSVSGSHFIFDVYFIADFELFGWVLNATPAHVADVQQAVDSAEVNEGAVIGQVLHDALHHGVFSQDFQRRGTFRVTLFFQQCAATQNDVASLLLNLMTLNLNFSPPSLSRLRMGRRST